MRILLDTHTLIRAVSAPSNLAAKASTLIENNKTQVFISIATLWELQIKKSLNKIVLPENFVNLLSEAGYEILNVTPAHIEGLGKLPQIHRDPFDRMLISQCICDKITLMTRDLKIRKYESKELKIFVV